MTGHDLHNALLVAEVESLRAKLAAAEQERDAALRRVILTEATLTDLRELAAEHWDWKAGQVLAARLRKILAAAEQDEPKRCEHAVCSCAMGALPRCGDEPKREQS